MEERQDLISRQAAIDALGKEGLVTAMEIIDRVPSAQTVARDINVLSNDLIIRQVAIDQLHQSYNLLDAERRLEDMPSVQPERQSFSCGQENDLISRKAAIDAVSRVCGGWCGFFAECKKNLIELPFAQSEHKHGHWVHRGCGVFECDQCGKLVSTNVYKAEKVSDSFKFCPECGLDMRGEQE